MRPGKAKAEKLRQHKRKMRDQEAEKLEANWSRIKQLTAGFGRDVALAPVKKQQPTIFRRETKHYPSHIETGLATPTKVAVKYEGELAKREARAQDEARARKSQVTILYNKGAYQLFTPGMDPKTIGRK